MATAATVVLNFYTMCHMLVVVMNMAVSENEANWQWEGRKGRNSINLDLDYIQVAF